MKHFVDLLTFVFLCTCSFFVGCKESADYVRETQKEKVRQFDSINKEIEKSLNSVHQSKVEVDTLSDAVRQIRDSLLLEAKEMNSELKNLKSDN